MPATAHILPPRLPEAEAEALRRAARRFGGRARLGIGLALRAAGELSAGELGAATLRRAERLEPVLAGLRRDGLVRAHRDARPRYSLTAEGQRIIDRI